MFLFINIKNCVILKLWNFNIKYKKLTLDTGTRNTLNKIFLQADVQKNGRQYHDKCRRCRCSHVLAAVREEGGNGQGDGSESGFLQEVELELIVVPDAHACQNNDAYGSGFQAGQDNSEKSLEPAASVDHSRLVQIRGYGFYKVGKHVDGQGQVEGG